MLICPRSTSYGVYISQLIQFARVFSHVDDLNTRNKILTAKFLRQGYRYHKIRKASSKFYWRLFDIVSKYNVGLKTLLLQDLSEPEFCGDLAYKFRKIIGKNWLVGCFGLNDPLRQYFSLYRAVSQREREKEKRR